MTVQKIIHDQIFLGQKSLPATEKDIKIAQDLLDTLVANRDKALGLSANMIGQRKNIIAFFVGPLPIAMLNAKIEEYHGQYETQEGCLSLSGERKTKRYHEIKVSYQTMNMELKEEKFNSLTAEVIQHELDHCQGKII